MSDEELKAELERLRKLRQSAAAGNGGRNPRDPEIRC
jgi:hypothetical protein